MEGADAVEICDSRRLTGPNLYGLQPGAVLELRVASRASLDLDAVIGRWRAALAEGLAALDWSAEVHARRFAGGAELMFTAPVIRLYAATELNEWAAARALGRSPQRELEAIAAAAKAEAQARRGAPELIAAAEARGVPWLIDDDELSLAYFDRCRRLPLGSLPAVEELDWAALAGPGTSRVALVTGTNGKTTTTRMLARIARKAGHRVGNTSTDGLFVDEDLVEAGDWTGPGGARATLRNPAVDLAVLEAARGGLLRRGAGVRSCAVAVITNIAADHFGEYGIFDLEGMAAAKGIVASIVAPRGRIVLGAESPALRAWAEGRELPAPVVWFASAADHPKLVERREHDPAAELWFIDAGALWREQDGARVRLCAAAELPASLGGLARHNLANALAAAAAARGLGIADDAIVAGLREFGARPEDNPGRARTWRVPRPGGGSVRLLLDFAHNLAGIAAIAEIVTQLEGAPILSFGMAGDRSDDELREQARALMALAPRRVLVREQSGFMRGRGPGEVPSVLRAGLIAAGLAPDALDTVASEPASLDAALRLAEDDDLIVLLAHAERETVDAWLRDHDAQSTPLT